MHVSGATRTINAAMPRRGPFVACAGRWGCRKRQRSRRACGKPGGRDVDHAPVPPPDLSGLQNAPGADGAGGQGRVRTEGRSLLCDVQELSAVPAGRGRMNLIVKGVPVPKPQHMKRGPLWQQSKRVKDYRNWQEIVRWTCVGKID